MHVYGEVRLLAMRVDSNTTEEDIRKFVGSHKIGSRRGMPSEDPMDETYLVYIPSNYRFTADSDRDESRWNTFEYWSLDYITSHDGKVETL